MLSTVMSLMPDAAVVVDSSGRIVSVNDQAEALFGYPAGSLAGAPVEALVPAHIRRRHRRHRLAFMADPETRPMGTGLEVIGRRSDGSEFPLDISLAPIVSEGGQLVVAAIRDLTASKQAAAQAELAATIRGYADEQAALRRVATLVATQTPPEEVFATVTEEVGRLLDVDLVSMHRYDPAGTVTVLAARPATLATGWSIGGRNVSTLVFETGRPARIDAYASGPGAVLAREWGVRSAVGAPITIEGRLWGVMFVASRQERALPAGTEDRLAGFTELVATSIANAEARAELRASRARIAAAAEATRRQIERDLHGGAQQRLVSLVLQLRAAQADMPSGARQLSARLDQVAAGLVGVVDELREFARGVYPAVLADGGLGPALRTLARRCPIPVTLDVQTGGRLPEPVEVCAYYVVSEALANAARHSRASTITVQVTTTGDVLDVRVGDDGVGGAYFGAGAGLIGLKDLVEALGGQFTLRSRQGEGTSVRAQLPLAPLTPGDHPRRA
jgi:PAS domain S-box-containing protein